VIVIVTVMRDVQVKLRSPENVCHTWAP